MFGRWLCRGFEARNYYFNRVSTRGIGLKSGIAIGLFLCGTDFP